MDEGPDAHLPGSRRTRPGDSGRAAASCRAGRPGVVSRPPTPPGPPGQSARLQTLVASAQTIRRPRRMELRLRRDCP